MQTLTAKEFRAKHGQAGIDKVRSASLTPAGQAEGDDFSIGETAGDVVEGVSGVISAFDQRSDVVAESLRSTYVPIINPEGTQLPLETVAQVAGQGVLAFGDTVFEVAKTAAKLASPESFEEEVGQAVQGEMEEFMKVDGVKATADWYKAQSPRAQRNLAIPVALLEILGFKGASKMGKTRKVADDAADVTPPKDVTPPTDPTVPVAGMVADKLADARIAISDIPLSAENAIKRSSPENIKKHAQMARDATAETGNRTNFEYVGSELAPQAHDIITKNKRAAGATKGDIINELGDRKVGDVPSGTTIDELQKGVKERFGVEVLPDGTIQQIAGRKSTLDAPSTKFLSEYTQKLRELGINPTVREVDDFVDWAQGRLYAQKESFATLDAANKPLVGFLQSITGSLNGKLKASEVLKGTDYIKANDEFARLIRLEDELSRGLGLDARKGGSFVKRIFSPSDARTKDLFAEIKAETGIDLVDEATIAKFFMNNSGDARQLSILEEMGAITQSVSQVEITKPGTWITFLKESADLDGEALALEIIRQAKRAEADGTVPVGTADELLDVAKKEGMELGPVAPTPTKGSQAVSSPNLSIIQRIKDKFTSDTPNKEGGFVKNPLVKGIDDATKREMVDLIDYLRLNKPYDKKMDTMLDAIARKYGINQDMSNTKIANKLESLIEGTKTMDALPGSRG